MAEETEFRPTLYDRVKARRMNATTTSAPTPQQGTAAATSQQPTEKPTKKRAASEARPSKATKRNKKSASIASDPSASNALSSLSLEAPRKVAPDGDGDMQMTSDAVSRDSPDSQLASVSAVSTPQHERAVDSVTTRETSFDSSALGLDTSHAAQSLSTSAPAVEPRPYNAVVANKAYADQLREILDAQATSKISDYRRRHAQVIGALLAKAQPANDQEVLCLNATEAKDIFSPGNFHKGPVLTEGQQPMPLQTVDDFLGEYYNDNAKLHVQDSSVKIAKKVLAVKQVTIAKVKERLSGKPSEYPLNCLELATHVEDGLRPRFLDHQDCRLITKLKNPEFDGTLGRRALEAGYKEIEKWALLAEGGAHTEPHQDSHGYSTYITVNQGEVGFGWMSNPSPEDRRNWHHKLNIPPYEVGDYWRYVVLRAGQTVTFPAGTVHFVFRLPSAGHSLAYGGHFLRCSTLVHWVKTMLEQKSNPDVSNEDLSGTAHGYLEQVEVFVRQAQQKGNTAIWGGDEAVEEFLSLKQQFMRGKKGKKA